MPKYEKPIAMPLGEAAKGSGLCNAGSGVKPPVGSNPPCSTGSGNANCATGNGAGGCGAGAAGSGAGPVIT
jgi:hypothetical protein